MGTWAHTPPSGSCEEKEAAVVVVVVVVVVVGYSICGLHITRMQYRTFMSGL